MALLSQSAYARKRGCSKQYVSLKVKDGTVKLLDGLVDSDAADKALTLAADPQKQYMGRVNAKQKGVAYQPPDDDEDSSPLAKYAKAKADRENWLAGIARLDYQTQNSELIPANDVEAVWCRIVVAVKNAFLAIPDRLQQMLTLSVADRDVIDAEIRLALEKLANNAESTGESSH